MKGIVNLLEVTLTAIILLLVFAYFFPRYSIKTQWDSLLLEVTVKDTLNVIDNMNKTYDFATDNDQFNNFMSKIFSPEYTGTAMVWWKDIENLDNGVDTRVPYFSTAKKKTIVDVVYTEENGFEVYSFTLGIGYVY